MAKEFDYNKPHVVIGNEKGHFWLQDGRRYVPPRQGKPPQALLKFGAIRTEGGGFIFKCKVCGEEFDFQVKLGRHKRETDCGYIYFKNKFEHDKERGWRVNRTLRKILTEEQFNDFIRTQNSV